jgi:tetratricopeptide (TPR) repeat protein
MTLRHCLPEKQIFMIRCAVVGVCLAGVIATAQAAAPQLDVSTILARAEAAFLEARFSDTIAMLVPLNRSLEGQPGRLPEFVRTKLQLALAHIGLNQLSEAKMLFAELNELDPQFSLDETKFAPKVVALFNEAKAATDVMPAKNAESAESIYGEAIEAYVRGDLPQALTKIHSVLALNPQNRLAAEYLVLINNSFRLSIEQLTLEWDTQFKTGDFANAAESYRRLLSMNLDGRANASLGQVRGEYRKVVADMARTWTQACRTQDQATMDSIRREANALLPEASIARDILDQMNNCASRPISSLQPPVATQSQPEVGEGCLENPSSVALVRLKSRVEPRLPVELRGKRSVRVQVTVKIDAAGNTRVYQVHTGSMPVTRAVVAAVNQWKFHPATYNDQPKCVETEFPVVLNR